MGNARGACRHGCGRAVRVATFPGLNGPLAYEAGGFPTPSVLSIQPLAEEDVPGTPTRLTSTDADRDAAWSSDGRRIAFMSGRDGNAEIYVINADGDQGQTRLTNDPWVDADPTFSPDGQIAFNSTRDGGNPEVYMMNGDGTGQTRLTFDPATDRQADWSPNGDWIAFESNRSGNFDLYAMTRAGGGLTQLTFGSDDDAEQASWHPDSTSIAYTSGPEGAAEVFTLVPGTPGRTRLATGPGDWHFPPGRPTQSRSRSPPCSARPTSCPSKAAQHPRRRLRDRRGLGAAAASGAGAGAREDGQRRPSGTVFVQVDGSIGRALLVDPHEIPVGSLLNTQQGRGRSRPPRPASGRPPPSSYRRGAPRHATRARNPMTELKLARLGCESDGDATNRLRTRTRAAGAASVGRDAKHKKWGVKGKYVRGSSTQTDWVTIDTCTKSIVRVRAGVVEVRDLVKGKTVSVPAGQSYIARARKR